MEKDNAVLDAEESGRAEVSWDLIGYLIGFVWIWAVLVALDGSGVGCGYGECVRVWRVG